ncbi:YdcF family protein [Pararhodonellum marinum]|uniref:YdcF family protein n=1 Tax=Pararhodonellum marinum TaxID=2755358 RepID=UPI00188F645B|nr:ElyC/SanA/YdcF family protein [Pararhodonellum marinum]
MRFLIHNFLINPAFWLALLLGWMIWISWRKGGWHRGVTALSVLLLIGLFKPLPKWLIASLENQYPPLLDFPEQHFDKPIHILVLGSGHVPDLNLTANQRLSTTALSRLTEAVRLYQNLPESQIIFSGKGQDGFRSSAGGAYFAALELGVDPVRMDTLHTPAHTLQESIDYVGRYGKDQPVILVTSAIHMPRAMAFFGHQGLNPIPAPAQFETKVHPSGKSYWLIPHLRNLTLLQLVLHEYLGRVAGHIGF